MGLASFYRFLFVKVWKIWAQKMAIFSKNSIFSYDPFFGNLRSKSSRFWMGQSTFDAITIFEGLALLVAVKAVEAEKSPKFHFNSHPEKIPQWGPRQIYMPILGPPPSPLI